MEQTQTKGAPLAFLGLACAVGVSSIYLNQPLLREMAATMQTTPERIGLVAVATQVGYAAGMLAFVPLGDVIERRGLMMRMYAGVAAALLLVAWSPTLPWLVAASVLTGMLASVTHIAVPIAPDLLPEEQRGRAIGSVMTGLLLGILLARTFSGWVSRIDGWRGVFVAAAAVNLLFVPLIWRVLPPLPPKRVLGHWEAMRSLWTLVRTQPLLREASVIDALMYGAFSCFWTTLAFLLGTHYGLGPETAGINTIYMTIYFSGAALGSWLSSLLWARFGWEGVMALAFGLVVLAALRHLAERTGQNPAEAAA